MANVCESLGLAVNLKVKLEYICSEGFYLIRDLLKSDHVCGSESWHEQRISPRTSEKELLLLIRL